MVRRGGMVLAGLVLAGQAVWAADQPTTQGTQVTTTTTDQTKAKTTPSSKWQHGISMGDVPQAHKPGKEDRSPTSSKWGVSFSLSGDDKSDDTTTENSDTKTPKANTSSSAKPAKAAAASPTEKAKSPERPRALISGESKDKPPASVAPAAPPPSKSLQSAPKTP